MVLSLTDKMVGFLARPVETFRAVRDEELTPPIIYWIILLIIKAILAAIVAYLGIGALANNPPGIGAFIAGLIGAFIVGIVALIIISILLHIGVKIMGGRGDFADSFKSATYAQTPNLLLGWIPIIGGLTWIWVFVLLVLGIRETHEMDTTRAIIAVVIVAVIIIIILGILLILGLVAILSLIGIASSSGGPIPVITMVSP